MKNRPQLIKGSPALYAALIIVFALTIYGLKQCSMPNPFHSQERIPSQGDTIDVAIEYGPTTFYLDSNDSLRGFGHAMLMALSADSLVVKLHPVASLAEGIDDLRRGLVDIVVAEMASQTDYDSTFRFTQPVLLDRQVLVQRRDSLGKPMVTSALDLRDKTVTVAAGSQMEQRLRNLKSEIGDTIKIVADSLHGPEQLFILVAVGDIPYAVVNERIAKSLSADYPNVDISTHISFTQFQVWMLRNSDAALAARLDSAIIRFKSTEAYNKLLDSELGY